MVRTLQAWPEAELNVVTFPCLRQDEVQVWEQFAPANVFKWSQLSDCGFGVGGTAEA